MNLILNLIFVVNGKQECFDEVNIWCDWPERVNCGNRPICDENDENCNKVGSFYYHLYSCCNKITMIELILSNGVNYN